MAARRKVLILAAVCHPNRGSEPGLGWNWSVKIADHHDVTVIAGDYEDSKSVIESHLDQDRALAQRIRFEFVPWFERPNWGLKAWAWDYYQPLYYAAYERWMRMAYETARRLMQESRYDLCHQLNMVGFREPGYLWQSPIPFVWGPIGGTQNVPWGMLHRLGAVECARHLSRNVINEYQKRFSRRFRQALARSNAVIAIASDTAESLLRLHGKESQVIAAAFGTSVHPLGRVRRPHGTVRFIYTGQHVMRKGVPFALQALARLERRISWTLDVLGAGVETESWKQQAERLRIADRVTFHGFVTRDRLFELLSQADVYVFPSLLEGWPASIAEALSLGLPVVTTDHQGMRDMVTPDCGILVDPSRAARLIDGLSRAFSTLAATPDLVEKLSAGALRRAAEISAEQQMPAILAAYDRAIQDLKRAPLATKCEFP